ncbi:MAG TPA: LytTR family DNA-binding domain-containing protein [Chitinophagaceae bacterium]|nr:LytTR family DNA-binding domain-containing protein [Chitinophagaceae bacterium]
MKVLLIDDETNQRNAVKQLLKSFCPGVDSIEEAESVKKGLELISKYRPDIVLLDVELGDGTGFDLMKQVADPGFQLIFITAHNKYAINAFRFSAIDYLLKPVDPDALQKAVGKAVTNIKNNSLKEQLIVLMQQLAGIQNQDRKIVLRDIDNTYFIKVSDILYCEAAGSYTRFYFTNNPPILVSRNLKEYEEVLEGLGFLRTHHSYLANPDKIKLFDKTDGGLLILEGGLSIPVSQRKKDFVMQVLENR